MHGTINIKFIKVVYTTTFESDYLILIKYNPQISKLNSILTDVSQAMIIHSAIVRQLRQKIFEFIHGSN